MISACCEVLLPLCGQNTLISACKSHDGVVLAVAVAQLVQQERFTAAAYETKGQWFNSQFQLATCQGVFGEDATTL